MSHERGGAARRHTVPRHGAVYWVWFAGAILTTALLSPLVGVALAVCGAAMAHIHGRRTERNLLVALSVLVLVFVLLGMGSSTTFGPIHSP